jgi:hypothetical protein
VGAEAIPRAPASARHRDVRVKFVEVELEGIGHEPAALDASPG